MEAELARVQRQRPIPEHVDPLVRQTLEADRKRGVPVDLVVDVDEEGADWLRRNRDPNDRPWE